MRQQAVLLTIALNCSQSRPSKVLAGENKQPWVRPVRSLQPDNMHIVNKRFIIEENALISPNYRGRNFSQINSPDAIAQSICSVNISYKQLWVTAAMGNSQTS